MWKRAILTSIIGATGGSSIIGFFNKYALYYHATVEGFRVPMEGVEYLSLAISLFSFAIILTSILGTILFFNLLIANAKLGSNIIKLMSSKSINNNLAAAIFVGQIIFLVGSLVYTIDLSDIKYDRLLKLGSAAAGFLAIIAGVLTIFLKLTIKRKSKKLDSNIQAKDLFRTFISFSDKIIENNLFEKVLNHSMLKKATLVFVLMCIVGLTTLLFNQSVYTQFLNTIKYGGGLAIEVEYRKADNTEDTIEGSLLIRTNSSLTLRNIKGEIEEIPNERISKIIWQSVDKGILD